MKYKLKRGNVYYVEDCYFNSIVNKWLWVLNRRMNGWKIKQFDD